MAERNAKICIDCKNSFEPPKNRPSAVRCHDCALANRKRDRHSSQRIRSEAYSARRKIRDAERDAERGRERVLDKTYVFLDGEATKDALGRSHYVLMIAAVLHDDDTIEILQLRDDTGRGLGTNQILKWLWTLPKGSYWFYSGGYDWANIFRQIPKDKLSNIFRSAQDVRDPFDLNTGWTEWNGWEIRKIQGFVELKKKGSPYTQSYSDGWKCWGGGPFVQQVDTWKVATPEIVKSIADMKDRRATFAVLDQEIIDYCIMECTLGVKMAKSIASYYSSDLDIRPRAWYSSGSASKVAMKQHNIPFHRGPDRYAGANEYIVSMINRCFFGGRFEVSDVGIFERLSCYDLSSAYPGAIKALPCLCDGDWHRGYQDDASVRFVHGSWKPTEDCTLRWGPLPYRDEQGQVWYAAGGEGVYCEVEWNAAKEMPGYEFDEVEWFSFVPNCEHTDIFGWVQDFYDLRKADKYSGRGQCLKILLNAMYGSIADTISEKSNYASTVWASLITGATRAKILEALAKHGDSVVYIATDGIKTTEPIDIEFEIPKTLGEWDREDDWEDCLIIQSGLAIDHGPKSKSATRGHGAKQFLALDERLRQGWDDDGWDAEIGYKRERFIGIRQGLSRKDYAGDVCQWKIDPVVVSFYPSRRLPVNTEPKGSKTRETMVVYRGDKLSSEYNKLKFLQDKLYAQAVDESRIWDEFEDAF